MQHYGHQSFVVSETVPTVTEAVVGLLQACRDNPGKWVKVGALRLEAEVENYMRSDGISVFSDDPDIPQLEHIYDIESRMWVKEYDGK